MHASCMSTRSPGVLHHVEFGQQGPRFKEIVVLYLTIHLLGRKARGGNVKLDSSRAEALKLSRDAVVAGREGRGKRRSSKQTMRAAADATNDATIPLESTNHNNNGRRSL